VRILERCQFRSIGERSFSSFSSFRGFHTTRVISLGGDRGRGPAYVRSTSDRVEILCTAVKDAKVESRMGAVAWAMRQRSVSHPRSSNRTCRFPASGSYGAFFVKGASRHFCRAFVTPFFCSTRPRSSSSSMTCLLTAERDKRKSRAAAAKLLCCTTLVKARMLASFSMLAGCPLARLSSIRRHSVYKVADCLSSAASNIG
jgi:hypothetical protein